MTVIDFIRSSESDKMDSDDYYRPLTAQGRKQAAALAIKVHEVTYNSIYASPLQRTVETVTPLATDHSMTPILDRRLIGLINPHQIDNLNQYRRQQWQDLDYAQPGGESIHQMQQRILSFCATLAESDHVAVVTHGTIMSSVVEAFWPGHGLRFSHRLGYTGQMRLIMKHSEMATLIIPEPFGALGQTVDVTIDRPLGSRHPRYPEMQYPLNYGYIARQIGGDGQPQDVYVLDEREPLSTWHGRIQAVIHRSNDIEDKWVGASTNVSAERIRQATQFQEQYFTSRLMVLDEHQLDN